jgi:hemerythrin-like domain-containing protein
MFDVAKEARERVMEMAEMVKGREEPQDALEMLKQDHELVSSIFEQIEEANSGKGAELREGLFSQLKYELETHAAVEEKLFYPALEKQAGDLIKEAFEEHQLVKQLLAELSTMSMDDEEWSAKIMVLRENVEHHVDEEESEIFALARKLWSESELRRLGRRIEEEKQALAGSGRETTERASTSRPASSRAGGRSGQSRRSSQRAYHRR